MQTATYFSAISITNLQTGAGNRRLDTERGQVCLHSPLTSSLLAAAALCGRRFRLRSSFLGVEV